MRTFRYYLVDAVGKPVAAGNLECPDAKAAIIGGMQLCQAHAVEGASGFEIWQGSRIIYRTLRSEMPDTAPAFSADG